MFYSNYLISALLGEKVPQDAQDHKNELNRITKYIMDLQEKVKKECDAFSEVSFSLEFVIRVIKFVIEMSIFLTSSMCRTSSTGLSTRLESRSSHRG